ncbi:MAG: RdgB/HAM1 family non-canonical purine NTP pyrophosphatase [Candidatus Omnitrophica bacterium]|nr:RdgB/HAM1 family non-canonical purine NTP pyrophosphatase [Candidatus Omnitrophota bacterium]
MKKLVIATRNDRKYEELIRILGDLPLLEVVHLAAYPGIGPIEETGDTFRENAIIKALAVSSYTGELSLADDSGLCVDALDGKPGVYSSRFAGMAADDAANIAKLRHLLAGTPSEKRGAHFICAVAIADRHGIIDVAEGRVDGVIADAPKGNNGFGYDPLFFLPGYGKTFAELDASVKNGISHRFRALVQARRLLVEYLERTEISDR